MADEYILQKSETDVTNGISSFRRSYNVRLADSNQGTYSSNQIIFSNLASLSNADANLSLAESFIEIPYTVSVTASGDGMNVDAGQEYMLGLKGFMNLIHSYEIMVDNNVIESTFPNANIPINFKIATTMSKDAENNVADSFNYAKDTDAIEYADILGETNYYATSGVSNSGCMKRMEKENFRPSLTRNALFTSATECGARHQSHCTFAANVIYFHYLAIIPLKYLSPYFANSVLQKGTYLQLTLNVNTATTTIITDATPNITSVATTSSFGTCPYIISKEGAGWTAVASKTYTIKSGIVRANDGDPVPHGTACYFNAVFYEMNPEMENSFYSRKIREITHDKFITSVVRHVEPLASFQHLISPAVSKARYLLIVPVLSQITNGRATPTTTSGGTAFSPMLSPFTTAGCGTTCFGASVTQFNVLINSLNHYKNHVNYGYEMFQNEILKSNSVSGGQELAVSSGLVSMKDWLNHMGFIYVDLKRKTNDMIDSTPVPFEIIGKNNTKVPMDYYCFICCERITKIDITNGRIVA